MGSVAELHGLLKNADIMQKDEPGVCQYSNRNTTKHGLAIDPVALH